MSNRWFVIYRVRSAEDDLIVWFGWKESSTDYSKEYDYEAMKQPAYNTEILLKMVLNTFKLINWQRNKTNYFAHTFVYNYTVKTAKCNHNSCNKQSDNSCNKQSDIFSLF